MEALVNSAYDRISEDVILLFDAFQAYEEANPRPPPSALITAIRQVLKEEEKGRHTLGVWNSRSEENLKKMERTIREHSRSGANFNQIRGLNGNGAYDVSDDEGDGMDQDTGLKEVLRVILTSVLSDLAVLPFWTVKVSAVAQRGRLPELYPFTSYGTALSAVIEKEGYRGLFKGATPVCIGGLLRYIRRNRQLYSDYYWKTTHRLTARLVMKDAYSAFNDPEVIAQSHEGLFMRIVWAAVLHPFDLIATRMITESSPQYSTFKSSVKEAMKSGFSGLLIGIRASLLNAILPFGNWYLLGVPFLVKTRRVLDGMEGRYRSGLGGSLDLLRAVLREEGLTGLFGGLKATCWGLAPAFFALCAARLLVYSVTGSSSQYAAQRRRRKALFRNLLSNFHPPKLGNSVSMSGGRMDRPPSSARFSSQAFPPPPYASSLNPATFSHFTRSPWQRLPLLPPRDPI